MSTFSVHHPGAGALPGSEGRRMRTRITRGGRTGDPASRLPTNPKNCPCTPAHRFATVIINGGGAPADTVQARPCPPCPVGPVMRGWPHCKCPSGDVTTRWWRSVRGPRPTQGRFWCPSIYVLLPFSKGRCLRPLGTSHGFANPTAPYCKNLPPVSASMEGDRKRTSVLFLPNRPRRQAAWRIRLTARSVPDTRAQGALRRFGSSSSGRGSTGAIPLSCA